MAAHAQQSVRQLPAKRTTVSFKIDGNIDEAAWKEAIPATDFVEWRPNAGAKERNKTEIYILYDNTSVYIGGYCHEKTKDSISRELIGRDRVGVNDFVGVILDTYNDKINAVGFYVTPYGEQYDARYSGDGNEDGSWNAVWDSEAKIHGDGWSFEMRIPYSALRFVSKETQTWGLNITRKRNKTSQQFMWNPVDPQKNGFINQEGEWTGIGKIESPIRLSFSPYFSAYANHYAAKKATGNKNIKDLTTSVNGGMDVKYGVSESFTLDVTLIPDFGQVPSDPQVLNLSPFEVQYQENRPFFIEGTELFNKGNLFYSRRVGGTPFNYGRGFAINTDVDTLLVSPSQSKLVNATKLSGRTKSGLGIGVFNAVSKAMFAEVEDKATGNRRKIETGPLTNYNILVFDQTMKNNSSVSLVNTNVLRNGSSRDANVTAGLFNINNKKNTYNWNGKFAVSKLSAPGGDYKTGYNHSLGFGKTGGQFIFNISQELINQHYNQGDLGFQTTSNYLDHYLFLGYRWTKPGKWYNQLRVNYNAGYSRTFTGNKYQSFFTNVNTNAQLKNLWWVGGFVGYNPEANNFFEAQTGGKDPFRVSRRAIAEVWFETNNAKKYSLYGSLNGAHHERYKGRSYYFSIGQRYRFSDKLSISHDISYQPFRHNVGFDGRDSMLVGSGLIPVRVFAVRNRITTEHSVRAKYSFNNKSGINLNIRHYWSEVDNQQYFYLKSDGELESYSPRTKYRNRTGTFNQFILFAEYVRQFAPGSFINIVWKNENFNDANIANHAYFKNLGITLESPHSNNLSVRVIYFLDYLDFKKWRKKKNT
ncbi:MAG: hypothetical protein JWP69_1997 [Flaviaesturariibacter sp.]|nr:hypothetical protein [Flaviaesturariibacter sp.]